MGAGINEIKADIKKLQEQRKSIYVSVQDFKVDSITTEKAIRSMAPLTSEITNLQKKLKKIELIQNQEDFLKRKREFLDK